MNKQGNAVQMVRIMINAQRQAGSVGGDYANRTMEGVQFRPLYIHFDQCRLKPEKHIIKGYALNEAGAVFCD